MNVALGIDVGATGIKGALVNIKTGNLTTERYKLQTPKSKKPKDRLTREDLPTDDDVRRILAVCSDSTRDKAMISVHAEAKPRSKEKLWAICNTTS